MVTKRRIDLLILNSNEAVAVDGADQGDLGIVDEGAVAVDGGKILEVASSPLLQRRYSARQQIDVSGKLALPGFVDPHTHLVFQGSRETEFQLRQGGTSYIDVLKKGGGIMETVNKTRQTSQQELVAIAQRRLDIATTSGTTTMEIKSGYGLDTQEEIKILKVIQELKKANSTRIAATFLGAHAIPQYTNEETYAKTVINEMIPSVTQLRLADFCDVFCEDGAFSAESSKKILKAGERSGLGLKIHADQFTDSGGARVANDIGAISADHVVHSDRIQLNRMTKTGVNPVVLPASSHSLLGSQYAATREMLSEGLPVALGTDFSPSNWILGQLTVAAIAARNLRMKSEEIIRGVTINAAKALGLDRLVGSLARGKSADIVVLKAPTYKRIGYSYGEGLVDKVLIAGKEIVRDGVRID